MAGLVLASCAETLVVSVYQFCWYDTFCMICRKPLCWWPFVATNMNVKYNSRFSIGCNVQWFGVHNWLLFRSASSLSEMRPEGCKSHHTWSKLALPGCWTLDGHPVVRLFLHISCLYDMCSWWWFVSPLSLLHEFVGTYHHCLLQWRWHHLLVMCFLMAVTSCHQHLESQPLYDEILVFWQGALTADEHGCRSQYVSNSNSASVKHLSLLLSPIASSQPNLPRSIHHLSSIIHHQWQLPILSLLNYRLDFPDIQ